MNDTGNALLDNRSAKKSITLLCAFLLPCILMLTVFSAIGVYPFGEKSLLIIDMNSEYVDYLAQMNESLRTGGSLMRTWNMGMGLNMLGLIAFYTSSPFNLLVMAFPVQAITEVLLAVTLLKVGLAGLAFAAYTNYALERRGLFAIAFSLAYAMSGYTIAYASNIMWLDGVAFLPLVLLGAEKILRENRYGTFLFSLIYVFFTSYYIGYMIGVFTFLYFTCRYFSTSQPLREYFKKLACFIGTAALAAGCCAFLLLPAFLGLRDGQMQMFGFDASFVLEKPFVRIASRLLPGAYDTLTDPGYPNIYCTLAGVFLCVCFFANRAFNRREKLIFGGLLGFLLLSFSCDFLDLAWHAFEEPTWFPARYSFVFCFLVLYLGMRAAKEMDRLHAAGIGGALLLMTVLFIEIGIGEFRYISGVILAVSIVLVVAYGLLWALRYRRAQQWAMIAAFFLLCAEVWGNAYIMELRLDEQFEYKSRANYALFRENLTPVVDSLQETDDGVYRMELLEPRNANGGMALGFNGISHYSTTTDQSLNAFLRSLAYNQGTQNELRFALSTPLTNGLLGIKYLLAQRNPGLGYELQANMGSVSVYKNTCAFPLAFWSKQPELSPVADPSNPFAIQNNLLEGISLSDAPFNDAFFSPLPDVEERPLNCDRMEMPDHVFYTPLVKTQSAVVEFTVQNPTGQPAYAYFPVWNYRFSPAEIFVNGVMVQPDLRYRGNSIVPLGTGETVTVKIDLHQNTARLAGTYFYTLDLEKAQQAAQTAQRGAMRFTRFTDVAVDGNVLAPQDGSLITTFPMDRGWKIWVDGKRAEPEYFANVFISLPLSAGEHEISMRYRTPGLLPGSVISAVCAAGILGFYLLKKRRKRPEGK